MAAWLEDAPDVEQGPTHVLLVREARERDDQEDEAHRGVAERHVTEIPDQHLGP